MYNVECPKCKAVNKNLDLYETAGWFECIECGEVSEVMEFREWYRVPHLEMSQVADYMRMSSSAAN